MNTEARKELIRMRAKARGWKPLTGEPVKRVQDSAMGRGFFSLVPMHVDAGCVGAKWIGQPDKQAEKPLGKRNRKRTSPLTKLVKKLRRKLPIVPLCQ